MSTQALTERISVDDDPAVVEATKRLAASERDLEECRREDSEVFSAISPYRSDETTGSRRPLIASERLRLEVKADDVRRRLRLLEADTLDLRNDLKLARAAAKRTAHAAIQARRQPVVAQLNAALSSVARINEQLAMLDEEAQAVESSQPLAWPEFFKETATCASRLDNWRREVRSAGLLAPDE